MNSAVFNTKKNSILVAIVGVLPEIIFSILPIFIADNLFVFKCNIKIMKLNGASLEPGHIYDDSQSTLIKANKDLLYHWKILAQISKQNIDNGLKPVSIITIIKYYFWYVVFKGK